MHTGSVSGDGRSGRSFWFRNETRWASQTPETLTDPGLLRSRLTR